MRRIQDEYVDSGVDQGAGAVQLPYPDRRTDAKAAKVVFVGVGVLDPFFDIFDRDQPFEAPFIIDDGELLDLVFVHDLLGLFEGNPRFRGHERHRGHDHVGLFFEVFLKTHVTVGQNPQQFVVGIYDRNAGDFKFAHQLLGFGERRVGEDVDRIDDDAAFGFFDLFDLSDLCLDVHVLVNDPDPPKVRHRNGSTVFGHRIHRRGDHRDVEGDVAGQHRLQTHLFGENLGVFRDEQDIFKSEGTFTNIHGFYPLS